MLCFIVCTIRTSFVNRILHLAANPGAGFLAIFALFSVLVNYYEKHYSNSSSYYLLAEIELITKPLFKPWAKKLINIMNTAAG